MSTENMSSMPAVIDDGMTSMNMMQDGAVMDRMIRFAEIMATGKATIPAELRNVGDCLAITMQAMNWKMNPFSVAQKTFFIGGKIGYEAQLVSAAITNSNAVVGNFGFEWFGPWEKVIGKFEIKRSDKGEYRVPGWRLEDENGIGIRCWNTLRGESEPRVLELLLAQARTRNSTLWADDPKQQLAYLAQKRWARLYAPGVILGVRTPDELEQPAERDMGAAEVVSSRPAAQPTPAALPDYSQDAFDKNLSAWSAAIHGGKLTAEEVITRASTKGVLSDAQKAQIRAAAQPKHTPEPEVIDAPEQKAQADDDGWLQDYEATEAQQ
jgi:hypothetical protein